MSSHDRWYKYEVHLGREAVKRVVSAQQAAEGHIEVIKNKMADLETELRKAEDELANAKAVAPKKAKLSDSAKMIIDLMERDTDLRIMEEWTHHNGGYYRKYFYNVKTHARGDTVPLKTVNMLIDNTILIRGDGMVGNPYREYRLIKLED